MPALRQSGKPRANQRARSSETSTTTTVTPRRGTPRTATQSRPQGRSRPVAEYSPTRVADRAGSGVGLLEAEFLAAMAILILTFVSGSATYGDKILTLMKRGSFVSILFFILALIAGTGNNAAKVAKGLGALVLVTTLVNSSSGNLFSDLDQIFKNISAKTSTAPAGSTSPSTGTSTAPGGGTSASAPSTAGGASGAAQRAITDIGNLQQDLLNPGYFTSNAAKSIIDTITAEGRALKNLLGF
jgi:hypothetical protein